MHGMHHAPRPSTSADEPRTPCPVHGRGGRQAPCQCRRKGPSVAPSRRRAAPAPTAASQRMRRRLRHSSSRSSSPRWLARQGSIAALPRHLRAQRRHISRARLPPRYSHADLSVKHQYPRFQRTLRVPQGHPGDGAWVQPERRAAVKRGVHTNAQRASGGVCPGYGECVTAQPLGWIHRVRVQRAGYVEPCTRAWCGELIDERYRMLAQAKRFPHSRCTYCGIRRACRKRARRRSGWASVTRGTPVEDGWDPTRDTPLIAKS